LQEIAAPSTAAPALGASSAITSAPPGRTILPRAPEISPTMPRPCGQKCSVKSATPRRSASTHGRGCSSPLARQPVVLERRSRHLQQHPSPSWLGCPASPREFSAAENESRPDDPGAGRCGGGRPFDEPTRIGRRTGSRRACPDQARHAGPGSVLADSGLPAGRTCPPPRRGRARVNRPRVLRVCARCGEDLAGGPRFDQSCRPPYTRGRGTARLLRAQSRPGSWP